MYTPITTEIMHSKQPWRKNTEVPEKSQVVHFTFFFTTGMHEETTVAESRSSREF